MTITRYRIAVVIAIFLLLGSALLWRHVISLKQRVTADKSAEQISTTHKQITDPQFVGAAQCKQCHAQQFALWRGSDHDLAMQDATPATVLGDFSDKKFVYNKITTTFFRRSDQFFVNTDGPDGKLRDYPIRYTFGIRPLQQYLIALPDGRMQALSIAWDTRPQEQGGQRWFHLYPGEAIDYRDPLHWSGREQNWNYMCAECHSTNLKKNYDFTSDTFHTTWSEINVACEACHGPGSEHVERAQRNHWQDGSGLVVQFPQRAHWTIGSNGNAVRDATPISRTEVETCAVCHSRRSQFKEGYKPGEPLLNTHLPALLTDPLYEADGQMRDEVFNYGSFLQSKMFAKGVTCSDCHEPHSLKLRLPDNGVCLQCHAADKYAVPTHHHHAENTPATTCAACHMPQRTYMGVDVRHDHSFRIPRPDLSQQFDTPNACNNCHRDKNSAWSAHAIEQWFGSERKGLQHFAPALHAARTQQLDAADLLRQLALDSQQPAIGRATASEQLAALLTPSIAQALLPNLRDSDGLVRLGAARALANAPLQQRWQWLSPLLDDPLRAIRIEVIAALAEMPTAQMTALQKTQFERALDEYIAAEKTNADRPEAHVNLGLLYARRGDAVIAEEKYRAALRLSPGDVHASINLADLYRQLGRDSESESVLRAALAKNTEIASLHHALAMWLVRSGRLSDAVVELAQAAKLAPEQSLYGYLHAVALHDSGQSQQAVQLLKDNNRHHPQDRATLEALINYLREENNFQQAANYEQQLRKITK